MALVGNLKDLKLPVIVQLNCMEKNTAVFIVEHHRVEGKIYFAGGNIVHATYGQAEGEDAVHKILQIKEAPFRVESDIAAPKNTISTPWSNLLMEGLQKIDEATEAKSEKMSRFVKEIKNVNGVKGVLICNKYGEIQKEEGIATGKRFAAGVSFLVNKVEKISRATRAGNLQLTVVTTAKEKVVITKWKEDNVNITIDPKLSLEVLEHALRKIFSGM